MVLINVIALLACSVLIAQAAEVPAPIVDDGNNLDALCAGDKIKLTRQSQLSSMIKQIAEGRDSHCSRNTVGALQKLHEVITKNKAKECSMDAFNNYREFYMFYLNNSDKKKFSKLPQPARKFAIAYGVQLSARCRLHMVEVLLNEASEAVDPDYFDAVKELIDPEGPIASFLGNMNTKPDRLLFPDLIESDTDKGEKEGRKMPLHVDAVAMIKRTQRRCERHFKPIYVDLMTPVLRFANLGFEHRSRELKEIIKEAKKNSETSDVIGRWSRVAFMCEVFGQIKLVVDEKDAEAAKGSDMVQVTVTTERDSTTEQQVEGKKSLLDPVESDDEEIKKVNFEQKLSVAIPDEIYPTELIQAVNKVKTNRAERVNMRSRYWSIMRERLWNEMKSLRAGPLVGQIYKGLKKTLTMKRRDNDDAKTKLVKAMSNLADTSLDGEVRDGGMVLFIGLIILIALIIHFCHWLDRETENGSL